MNFFQWSNFQLLSDRQKRAFKNHKVAYWSLWFLISMIVFSTFSEFIANSKPLFMTVEGKAYFPVLQNITPVDLGISTGEFTVDFRKFSEEHAERGFFIWPLIRFDPNESDRSLSRYPSAPDKNHWLGTDDRGRDVLVRLIYGLRNSLLFAISVWILSYMIGIMAGAVQGYYGGKIDFAFQRFIEIFNGIPYLFLLIILVSMLKPGMWLLILINVVFGWIGISYYVRVEFLRLRKLEFTEAARALGVGKWSLFLKHYLPNSLTPVITFSPFALTSSITALAGLDYLGFGLAPPSASWGELLNQAMKHFDHAWWLAVFPSLALASTLMVLNFVGEGLRQALDPRSGN